MTIWKNTYHVIENWGGIDVVLSQHRQLLETGGFPCKVLFRNLTGQEIATPEDPIPISIWDDSTSTSPRKKIWKDGDDVSQYPDPTTIKVYVDGNELTQTYNYETIQNDNEFYVEIQNNLIDYQDNVSIYLNRGFNVSGKDISYIYSTRGKNVSVYNLQPKDDELTYRSVYGFSQYVSSSSSFRGMSFPNTILISFPPPPAFDTKFFRFGRTEQWVNRAWALGDVQLHEFDALYRVSDGRWFTIRNWEPNYMFVTGAWRLLTQSFEVTQLAETSIERKFPLV